ncbi:MAG: hypothetical protein IKG40_03375 [Bacilli bacterium]|nr:hypothetical protein [Bacilli bacterium]
MLDNYKENQEIAYKILKNAIVKEKCSHAYLFETGGFSDSMNLIISFVKAIQCPNKYTNNKNCKNCNICTLIDTGNNPEVKIINPDGLWIKKEQVKELMQEFNKKVVLGNKKIYIINGADKLNATSANSILKFLEEPEENVIAILVTENLYNVLETIRSRCQIITLRENKNNFQEENTPERIKKILKLEELNEEHITKIQKIINFINYYEENHLKTIIYMNKLWHDHIKNKEELINGFEIIILYYKDILNNLLNKDPEIFVDYTEEIRRISNKNSLNQITRKLLVVNDLKEKIKFNANTNLLMDKLIIELEGGI